MLNILLELIKPENILMMNVGVLAGIIIGALPGLSVTLAIALLLPLTFGMESIPGMFILLGAYCGGMYGGSITAILINTPGYAGAAATVLDGYPMAKKGHAADALKIALVASTTGGIISALSLIFLAPPLASFGLRFGPPEYFALTLFGLAIIASISVENLIKGLMAAAFGLFISTIGMDGTEGVPRFMFGNPNLLSGFSPVVVLLGIYAISEMLDKVRQRETKKEAIDIDSKSTVKMKDIYKHWKIIIKSALAGVFIGAVPGTGGAIAAFFSYDNAKRSSDHPEKFGTGIIEGIIAPETGNNAVTGSTLIPMLTLGIPGDVGVAVLMGALIIHGIIPGPELFAKNSVWVYTIMAGVLVINFIMLLQGSFLIKFFAKVTKVPFKVLLPCVLTLCALGAYAVSNSMFDVYVMMGAGFLGYLMKRFDFPIAPLTIALILGQLAEKNLRRSLILSDGSFSIFFTRPIAAAFMIVAIFSILRPIISIYIKGRNK
jgi:putative tricarboxylic transport membrane protein